MKINLNIEAESIDEMELAIRRLAGNLDRTNEALPPADLASDSAGVRGDGQTMATPSETGSGKVSSPEGEAVVSMNDETEPPADKAQELIQRHISEGRKPAQTVGGKDGARFSIGDEVKVARGAPGVIEGLFRGIAIVRYEDGSVGEIGSSTMEKPLTEDMPAPEEETPKEEVLDLGGSEGITFEQLKAKATEAVEALGGGPASKIVQAHSDTVRLADIPDDIRVKVYNALDEAVRVATSAKK